MVSETPSDWRLLAISECMSAIIDYRGKTPRKTTFGIPLITAKIVKGGRIADPCEYIAHEDYDDWMRRGIPQTGDVVMTTEAPLGEIAQLDARKVALAQRLITLRGIESILDNTFLKFAMQSASVQGQLRARATGTTVLGIRQSELRKIELPIPPLNEQLAIAEILGSLDDKIELNRRMNRTLEQMAAAIFKAWFVDFEPVKAKASGAKSFPSMPQEVFDALPTEFTESRLGPFPKGWTVSNIKEQCSVVMGQSPKSEYYNEDGEGLPFHQGVRAFGERFPTHGTHCTVANRLAESRDILFSVRAPVGRINVADRRLIVGRGLAAIRHRDDAQSFLLYALKHQFQAEDLIGSGTIFASVTKKDMEDIRLLIPLESCLQGFERIAGSFDQRYALNVRESGTLASIRDALLPKLLSGEIRIGEAERVVEDVA